MTPEQEEIRGNDAERLLRDPLLIEAFQTTEDAIVDRLKTCAVGDKELHHELILTLQLLGRVKGYLETVAQTGKMVRLDKINRSFTDRILRRA